jgi:hypothetical protein
VPDSRMSRFAHLTPERRAKYTQMFAESPTVRPAPFVPIDAGQASEGTERHDGRVLCRHIGEPLGFAKCGGCCGGVRLKKFECTLHEAECVPAIKPATDKAIRWCQECPDNTPPPVTEPAASST